MTAECETEISRTIWNNKLGTSIVVKPDGDGLGLITVNQDSRTITVTREEANLLADALVATALEVPA